MNSRQIQILEKLMAAPGPLQPARLAGQFGVSRRTIQNDLGTIGEELRALELTPPATVYGQGVALRPGAGERGRLEELIYAFNGDRVVLSPEERGLFILKLFLLDPGHLTPGTLGRRLDVSRGTVLGDLSRLRGSMEPENIHLHFDSRHGYILSGDEGAIRTFAVRRFVEQCDPRCLLSAQEYHKASLANRFYSLRGPEDSAFIFARAEAVNADLGKWMTGAALLRLLTGLELAVERVRLGHTVSLAPLHLESLSGTGEFRRLFTLLEELGERFGLTFPPGEVGYLTLETLGSKLVGRPEASEENYADIQLMVCALIARVEEILGEDFSGDEALYHDLVHHIRPAIFRMQHGIHQENPLKGEILTRYGRLCKAVGESAAAIEEQVGRAMSADEVCFIALHFASVLEKRRGTPEATPRVLIVCDSGIGTSNLLSARLTALYEVEVVATVAFYELERAMAGGEVDYIISTLDMEPRRGTVLHVSPLIGQGDMALLDRYFRKRVRREVDQEAFFAVLERYGTVGDREGLRAALGRELAISLTNTSDKRGGEKMLIDVIDQRMISLDFDAADWEAAVREAGRLLLESGCVDPEYVDSMVRTVQTMGSYIVIAEGIALPHSRSGEHAHKVGVSFVRLRHPVEFGHPENDPVDLVFGLSSVDNNAHLTALKDLSKILTAESRIDYLRNAGTAEEVYTFLCRQGGGKP